MLLQSATTILMVLSNLIVSMILLEDGVLQHVELKRLGCVIICLDTKSGERKYLEILSFW